MLSLWNAFDDVFRFDDAFRTPSFPGREGRFNPAVDVVEKENAYLVKAELPGMKAEDVDIRVEGNLLTLSGEQRFEEKKEDEGYRRIERRYGSFCRSFTLPENVKADAIEANMSDGILTLTIPKGESAGARRIEVRTGGSAELPPRERSESTPQRSPTPRASA